MTMVVEIPDYFRITECKFQFKSKQMSKPISSFNDNLFLYWMGHLQKIMMTFRIRGS